MLPAPRKSPSGPGRGSMGSAAGPAQTAKPGASATRKVWRIPAVGVPGVNRASAAWQPQALAWLDRGAPQGVDVDDLLDDVSRIGAGLVLRGDRPEALAW